MKIYCWNVNGFRAVTRNTNWLWLQEHQPDVLCLQEVKAQETQVEDAFLQELGYRRYWNGGLRPGYSGVAVYSKIEPGGISAGIFRDGQDAEGRVIALEMPGFDLYSIYFPNGQRDHERLTFKLDFYRDFLSHLQEELANGKKIVLCGDFNTAHMEIDLANPRENENTSGFMPIERDALQTYFDAGFVDIYRQRNPDKVAYTWWTYRVNARVRNIGWRIDYFLLSPNLLEKVADTQIHADIMGSDHCPISLSMI
mgnify:CR=1 FL=1